MLQPLLIWGASGHATVISDAVRLDGAYEVAGFLDDFEPTPRPFARAAVLGGRDQLPVLAAVGVRHLIFGFGDCMARLELAPRAELAGFEFATVIHPHAVIAAGVAVGPGTFIAAGAIVNPGVTIGCHVIVNTAASVDHDCVLEDGCHVCPGARLAGNVTIGRGAWVGIGAIVIQRVTIGAGAIIGAGAVVLRDIPAGALAYGVPARVVQTSDTRG